MNPIELPRAVSRAEWLSARKALLAREKELTRARDRLNADRRRLPMVEVTEPYAFEGAHGALRLLDLFEGRQQLMIYHFMWRFEDGKPLDRGCPSCSGFGSAGAVWSSTSTRAPWQRRARTLPRVALQSPVGEMRNSAMSSR